MPEEAIESSPVLTPASGVIKKLLVANRSEIAIRVFRSAHELGIRTVAIYAHEDRFALHRFKADEAYRVGTPGEPLRAYLDIDGIVNLAERHEIDAIHPGYGFLSENPHFAHACHKAGIIFVGPKASVLENLGDKFAARRIAREAKVPVLSGSDEPVTGKAEARKLAKKLGYPVIVKASMGGGGRGMRVALSADQLDDALDQAQREAGTAFGIADVFLEKYVQRPPYRGPAFGRSARQPRPSLRTRLLLAAASSKGRRNRPGSQPERCDASRPCTKRPWPSVAPPDLDNAGTVEFLFDTESGEFYFIEVNPRIQVEHTVTEEITGYDIVKTQILIAQGKPLGDPEIGLGDQTQNSAARLRPPVPGHDRRPDEQVRAGLRPAQPLPLGERPGHSPGRRHRFFRRRHHSRFMIRYW